MIRQPQTRASVVAPQSGAGGASEPAPTTLNASELLKAIIEGTPDSAFVKDRNGCYLMINAAAARVAGKPVEDIIGRDDRALFPADFAGQVMAIDRAIMHAGTTRLFVEKLPSGQIFSNLKGPVHDSIGNVIGIFGLARDITHIKQAENRLYESEERFRAAFERAAIGMAIADGDGRVNQINACFCDMLGYAEVELLGTDLAALTHPEDRAQSEALQRRMQHGELDSAVIEKRYIRKNGEPVWVRLNMALVRDRDGRILQSIGHAENISARKDAETALQRYRNRLEILVDERTAELERANEELRQQIAEREKAEERLKEEHALLTAIAEGARDAIFCKDPQGRYVMMNAAGARLLERTTGEILGADDLALFPAAQSKVAMDNDRRVMATGESVRSQLDAESIGLDGFWETVKGPVRDAWGEIVGVFGIARDISERMRLQSDLRESEALFRSAFDDAAVPMALGTAEGKLTRVNRALCNLIGYSSEELVGHSWEAITHPDDHDLEGRLFQALVSDHTKQYTIEKRLIHKSGDILWGLLHVVAVRDAEGRLLHFLGQTQDITERKQAEFALRQAEEQLRDLVDHTETGVVKVDESGCVIDANDAYVRLIGAPDRDSIRGRSVLDWTAPECVASNAASIGNTLVDGRLKDFETTYVQPDGSRVEILVNAVTERSEEGLRVAAVCRNMTDRKRFERQLELRTQQLRKLAAQLAMAEERERRRLAAGLHDSIVQDLALCQIKLGGIHARQMTGTKRDAVKEVRAMIDAMIQRSRSLIFELSPPVLHELGLEAALEWLCEKLRAEHDVEFVFEDDRQPKPVSDDQKITLFQATRELMLNVIKHADTPSAKVRVSTEPGQLAIVVEDQGRGFDMRGARMRDVDNQTFGLFSIRERLELLGGRLQVFSGEGQGTRITLTVPLQA